MRLLFELLIVSPFKTKRICALKLVHTNLRFRNGLIVPISACPPILQSYWEIENKKQQWVQNWNGIRAGVQVNFQQMNVIQLSVSAAIWNIGRKIAEKKNIIEISILFAAIHWWMVIEQTIEKWLSAKKASMKCSTLIPYLIFEIVTQSLIKIHWDDCVVVSLSIKNGCWIFFRLQKHFNLTPFVGYLEHTKLTFVAFNVHCSSFNRIADFFVNWMDFIRSLLNINLNLYQNAHSVSDKRTNTYAREVNKKNKIKTFCTVC